MNPRQPSAIPAPRQSAQLLANRLRPILETLPLDQQRTTLQNLATELSTDVLQCAAALLHLLQTDPDTQALPKTTATVRPVMKMIRYRLDIGSQHQLTEEQLKKVLVEESGVDKNNIANVSIRGAYTLIDLPDAMPQDIYQHLKSVEINQRKLDIKKLKSRKKRHAGHHRGKIRENKPENAAPTTIAPNDPAPRLMG